MAILVLFLSFLPCADGAAISEQVKTELISTPDQQDNDHEDACSPFCQCSWCAGFSISHLVARIASFSRFGLSVITLVFENDVNAYFARQLIPE